MVETMWNDENYDELKTFQTIIDENTKDVVFGSVDIDEATQNAIIAYFQFRKVSDNDRFIVYFQRLLNNVSTQYNGYLRVQSIQFDPMVTNYLERMATNDSVDSRTDNKTATNTFNETGSNSSTNSDTGTTTSSGSSSATDSTNSNNNTNTVSSSSGSDNSKSMNAQLPQSSTGASGGLPDTMNWTYASSQDESKNTRSDNATSTGSGAATSNGESTSENNGTATTTNDGSSNTDNQRKGDNTTTDSGNSSGSNSSTLKERSTGRSGEAPELLKKAVSYITRTNAFFWLVDELETVFITNY